MNLAIRGKARKRGFSLVEVVLAIGIVSFSMLAILGVLPVGIHMVQDSMLQQARASITNQLRSKLQQISYTQPAPGNQNNFSIDGLTGTSYYYTREGIETTAASAEAYYLVTFELQDASIDSPAGLVTFDTSVARNVNITLSYPLSAPVNDRKALKFSLFSAKQKNY